MTLATAVLLAVLVFALIAPCQSLRVSGVLSSNDGFAFAGRFCFDYSNTTGTATADGQPIAGKLTIAITAPANASGPYYVSLFDDQSSSWPAVQSLGSDATCRQRVDVGARDSYQLDSNGGAADIYIVQRLRPRFWFIAVTTCAEDQTATPIADVHYDIHFQNVLYSQLAVEFGADEAGVNYIYTIAFIAYVVLMTLNVYGAERLRRSLQFVHPIIRLLTACIAAQFVSVTLYALHYDIFTFNGVGVYWFIYPAAILDVCSRIGFVVLLLLLASGWTISNKDTRSHKLYVAIGLAVFGVFNLCVLIYGWASFDPQSTRVTVAESALQYTLIAVYLCFGIFFIVSVFGLSRPKETMSHRRTLYVYIGVLFGPWLIAPPVVSILVVLLDDWVRLRIITTINVIITFVAFAAMNFLFWPTRAVHYFAIDAPDVSSLEDQAVRHLVDYERL